MTRYTRDPWNQLACAICGAHVPSMQTECCPTAPYMSLADFTTAYFPGSTHTPGAENYVPRAIAREFYDDYLHSNCSSLQDYIQQTTGDQI